MVEAFGLVRSEFFLRLNAAIIEQDAAAALDADPDKGLSAADAAARLATWLAVAGFLAAARYDSVKAEAQAFRLWLGGEELRRISTRTATATAEKAQAA